MGIDEVMEVAVSLKGKAVIIINNNGQEIRGRLVDLEDFHMKLEIDPQKRKLVELSLGDIGWISRA